MAPTRGTPTRPIRIDPGLWDRFGEATSEHGTDRSTVLRDFIRWYVREPDAKTPKRPDAKIVGNNSGTNQREKR